MKNLIVIALPLILTIALQSCSCKKNNLSSPVSSGCKIVSIDGNSSGSSLNITISYTASGKIAEAITTAGGNTQTSIYSYTNNLIITHSTESGNIFGGYDSVVLNSLGMATYVLAVDNLGDTTVSIYNYTNGELANSTDSYSSGDPSVTKTYQYKNGDLASSWDGTDSSYYQYYTNEAWQQGDGINAEAQFLGAPIFTNTHLIKSIQTGTDIQVFSYTYDASGKITSVSSTDNGLPLGVFNYTYNCQ